MFVFLERNRKYYEYRTSARSQGYQYCKNNKRAHKREGRKITK